MGDFIGKVDPSRGIGHIRNALALLEVEREPRLELCAQHDLGWFLNDDGRPEEALAVLEQARHLYEQFPDAYTQFRLHWLEARIAQKLGQLEEAESTFEQLWHEFRARDLRHELVLLSIDLAELFVEKGGGPAGGGYRGADSPDPEELGAPSVCAGCLAVPPAGAQGRACRRSVLPRPRVLPTILITTGTLGCLSEKDP